MYACRHIWNHVQKGEGSHLMTTANSPPKSFFVWTLRRWQIQTALCGRNLRKFFLFFFGTVDRARLKDNGREIKTPLFTYIKNPLRLWECLCIYFKHIGIYLFAFFSKGHEIFQCNHHTMGMLLSCNTCMEGRIIIIMTIMGQTVT